MKRLALLAVISSVLAVLTYQMQEANTFVSDKGVQIPRIWTRKSSSPQTPSKYCRRIDQAILSVPEWYLVFSPQEQASYFNHTTSTSFPYMRQNAQIWDIHKIVREYTDTNHTDYKYNGEYQLMIYVINSSSSAEYITKSWYERVVGRLTDTRRVLTEEDRFNAVYQKDYVDFINDNFWYEFDFKERLKQLWQNTNFFGDHFFRKMERKYYLTSELLVKWGYGKLIRMGAETIHGPDDTFTAVLVDSIPKKIRKNYEIIQDFQDGSSLVKLHRYARFNPEVSEMALSGLKFREIAGNNAAIYLTVLVPNSRYFSTNYSEIIFTQPIPSNSTMKRQLIAVEVKNLNHILLEASANRFTVEHIFDY